MPEPGYDCPARPGDPIAAVATPALILDLDAFERNLDRMADFARELGVDLRPHAKMHKSADVARAQIARGAVGICCQKVSEAEALARAGITDILIANEVVTPGAIARLVRLAARARIAVCADDPGPVAALSAAVAAAGGGLELEVLVEMDCGGARCGTQDVAQSVALAQVIAAAPGLRFGGLQSYYGGAQHIYDATARRAALARSIALTAETRDAIEASGLPCARVTGAGTGTFLIEGASGVYTEIQPGSYAFMDRDYGAVHEIGGFEHALFVLASVISHPAGTDRAVCDMGLKAVAVDSGLPLVAGLDGVEATGVSDEHCNLRDPAGHLRIGDQLRLIPGHCDPTCNLHDWYVGLRGGQVECLWPVTARGKVF